MNTMKGHNAVYKNKNLAGAGKRSHFSIASGLNNRFVLRLLAIFLVIDIFTCASIAVGLVWHAERIGAEVSQKIKAEGLPAEDLSGWTEITGYQVERIYGETEGFVFPQKLQHIFPGESGTVARSIFVRGDTAFSGFSDIDDLCYRYEFTADGRNYSVTVDFRGIMPILIKLLAVFLFIQILFLLKTGLSGARRIRQRLKPIEDLAEAAQSLNTPGKGIDLQMMESLADKLDGINASKLDTRISVDATQDELKNLAEAINGMLERINESYRSQIRFVSDASHELRTPISVIQGYANLLERWGKNDEKTLQESIRAINDEAANMKSLVEQLLFLARGDNNTMKLQLEEFDLASVAEEVIKESEMIDCGHEYEIRTQPVMLYADKGLIKQALRILTDNAIKYSNAGGTIRISVSKDENMGVLEVQDEGIGIPPESVPLIFDRFYRADQSRARATGGTGLGLSIAKWITERHGGHMSVLSREDLGTRISIAIPVSDQLPAEVPQE